MTKIHDFPAVWDKKTAPRPGSWESTKNMVEPEPVEYEQDYLGRSMKESNEVIFVYLRRSSSSINTEKIR